MDRAESEMVSVEMLGEVTDAIDEEDRDPQLWVLFEVSK
jgi:hypothetical protein